MEHVEATSYLRAAEKAAAFIRDTLYGAAGCACDGMSVGAV